MTRRVPIASTAAGAVGGHESVRGTVALLAHRVRAVDAKVHALAWQLEREGQPAVVIGEGNGPDAGILSDIRPSIRLTAKFVLAEPRGLRRIAAILIRSFGRSPAGIVRTAAAVPAAVALAGFIRSSAVPHLHVVDGDRFLVSTASVAAALANVTFSIGPAAASSKGDVATPLPSEPLFRIERAPTESSAHASLLLEHIARHDATRLGERETTLLREAERHGFEVTRLRRIHVRNDSVVAELTAGSGSSRREIVLKQQKGRAGQSRPPAERAAHEADVLRRLRHLLAGKAAAGGEPVFSVPEVLHVDSEGGTVIMTRAAGVPLDRLMTAVARRRDLASALGAPLRDAGRWLWRMQEVTAGTVPAGEALDAIASRFRADLELVSSADRSIERRRSALESSFGRSHDRISSAAAAITGHHGDFWPGNVFVSPERVEVIDFEGFRAGLPLEDVAYFLVFLDLMFPRFGGRVPELRAAFLTGYDSAIDEESLKVFIMTKALQMMARQLAMPRGGPLGLWTRAHLRRLVIRSLA